MSIKDSISVSGQFDQAAKREKLQSPQIIQKTKAVRHQRSVLPDLSIFEVQSASAVEGVYNCYRQTTYGSFGPPSIEVLNIVENKPFFSGNALAVGDRISAWQMPNDEGTMHWVGHPATPSVRMARTTAAAGGSSPNRIRCNLVANDGETEITSGLGSNIWVYFKITNETDAPNTYLNAALPRFANNDYLFVQNIGGKWWHVAILQGSENCVCSEE